MIIAMGLKPIAIIIAFKPGSKPDINCIGIRRLKISQIHIQLIINIIYSGISFGSDKVSIKLINLKAQTSIPYDTELL